MPVRSAGPTSPQRASTLIELLVALPLAVLVAAAAAMLLVRVARSARAQSAILATTRELRHVRAVLGADLAALDGRDLRTVADTMLEFRGLQGVLHVCDTPDPRTVIAAVPSASSDLWVAALRESDPARLWRRGRAVTDPPTPVAATLGGAPAPLSGGACGVADLLPARRWRLTLRDSVAPIAIGAPLSVHRDVRYRHYRSAGRWWLGRQTRDGAVWEGIQPVAGPLHSPIAGGLRLEVHDALGGVLGINATTPDSVRAGAVILVARVRAARRAIEGGATTDSGMVTVPLRASSFRTYW